MVAGGTRYSVSKAESVDEFAAPRSTPPRLAIAGLRKAGLTGCAKGRGPWSVEHLGGGWGWWLVASSREQGYTDSEGVRCQGAGAGWPVAGNKW